MKCLIFYFQYYELKRTTGFVIFFVLFLKVASFSILKSLYSDINTIIVANMQLCYLGDFIHYSLSLLNILLLITWSA